MKIFWKEADFTQYVVIYTSWVVQFVRYIIFHCNLKKILNICDGKVRSPKLRVFIYASPKHQHCLSFPSSWKGSSRWPAGTVTPASAKGWGGWISSIIKVFLNLISLVSILTKASPSLPWFHGFSFSSCSVPWEIGTGGRDDTARGCPRRKPGDNQGVLVGEKKAGSSNSEIHWMTLG